MLDQIQICEDLSYDGIWFAKHWIGVFPFPSSAIFATVAALKTSKIRFGTGATLLPFVLMYPFQYVTGARYPSHVVWTHVLY